MNYTVRKYSLTQGKKRTFKKSLRDNLESTYQPLEKLIKIVEVHGLKIRVNTV